MKRSGILVTATTACLLLGLASFADGKSGPEQPLPRIASPEALAIEMAKALVAADRARFTALAATREEMERLLETAQPPASPQDRQELKDKVADILADRGEDFDRFQAMKKAAGLTTCSLPAWLGLHLSLAGDRERDVEEVSDREVVFSACRRGFGRTKMRGGQTR